MAPFINISATNMNFSTRLWTLHRDFTAFRNRRYIATRAGGVGTGGDLQPPSIWLSQLCTDYASCEVCALWDVCTTYVLVTKLRRHCWGCLDLKPSTRCSYFESSGSIWMDRELIVAIASCATVHCMYLLYAVCMYVQYSTYYTTYSALRSTVQCCDTTDS